MHSLRVTGANIVHDNVRGTSVDEFVINVEPKRVSIVSFPKNIGGPEKGR